MYMWLLKLVHVIFQSDNVVKVATRDQRCFIPVDHLRSLIVSCLRKKLKEVVSVNFITI